MRQTKGRKGELYVETNCVFLKLNYVTNITVSTQQHRVHLVLSLYCLLCFAIVMKANIELLLR